MQNESQLQEEAAGPIRPSLPWCFSPATRSLDSSLDRSCAERKPAQSVLHCHGVLALRHGAWAPAWTGAVQNESQLQEDTSRMAVGSAETQVKSRFGTSFYSVRKVTFGSLG